MSNSLQEEITRELLQIKSDIDMLIPQYMKTSAEELKVNELPSSKKQEILKSFGGSKLKNGDFVQKLTECLLGYLIRMKRLSLQATNINPQKPLYLGQMINITMFYYNDRQIQSFVILEELTKRVNQKIQTYFENNREKLKLIKEKELQLLKIISKGLTINNNEQQIQGNFIKCYCHIQEGLYSQIKQKLFDTIIHECNMCHLSFHGYCIKQQQNIIGFVCPYCTLLYMDPTSKVKEQIVQPTFQQFHFKNEKQFIFECPLKYKGYEIEIRCFRVDGQEGLNEITWPDLGEIHINGNSIKQFKPLTINYSLKKRKDDPIKLTNHIKFNEQNKITLIEEKGTEEEKSKFRILSQCQYFIGIVAIQEIETDQLIHQIQSQYKNYLSIDESIKSFQNQDIEISSIKISILCPISMQMINIPVRGKLCNHLQCFDLQNFVRMTMQMESKKWRCPICKLKCYNFLIDDYQQVLINVIKENKLCQTEIEIDEKGQPKDSTLKLYSYNQLQSINSLTLIDDNYSRKRIKQ